MDLAIGKGMESKRILKRVNSAIRQLARYRTMVRSLACLPEYGLNDALSTLKELRKNIEAELNV